MMLIDLSGMTGTTVYDGVRLGEDTCRSILCVLSA